MRSAPRSSCWLLGFLAACGDGGARSAPVVAAPCVSTMDAAVAPPIDAGGVVDAALAADAGPPAAPPIVELEVELVDRATSIGDVELDVTRPRFTSRPAWAGKALDERVSAALAVGDDRRFRGQSGALSASCEVRTASRALVCLRCSRLEDLRTRAEADRGEGGAPGEATTSTITVWVRPGLPRVALADVVPAPLVEPLRAGLAKVGPGLCAGADVLRRPVVDPDAFVIDEDGLSWTLDGEWPGACHEQMPSLTWAALGEWLRRGEAPDLMPDAEPAPPRRYEDAGPGPTDASP